jgi:hypothetical protein
MTITGEQAFISWTAAAGPWARWIKPSLFAPEYFVNQMDDEALPNVGWLPQPNDTALVLDLASPGVVRMGVALAQRGYCPVPMFNTTSAFKELFPAAHVADTLLRESIRLSSRTSGPPAFLLDVRREVTQVVWPQVGDYDNRWYVFASDFPTEQALKAAGIHKLLVVCEQLNTDLRDALARHTGLTLELLDPKTELRARFPKPRWLALRAIVGLAHGSERADGSFGHVVPEHTSGG